MGEPVCDLLEAELGLDRLEAELAAELPGHLRAFAHAYAAGQPIPPAPAAARRPRSLALARRALAHPLLDDRALALVRLLAPIAIEDDPAVAAARAAPLTWDGLAALARARDAASTSRYGLRFVELVHRLHGSAVATNSDSALDSGPVSHPGPDPDPHPDPDPGRAPDSRPASASEFDVPFDAIDLRAPIAGWHDRGPVLEREALEGLARALAREHGASGAIRILESASARPRAFLIEPGRLAIIVVPARVDTPAACFAVLHELGHAIAALLSPTPLPRVVDEAAAAYVARLLELAPPPAPLIAGAPSLAAAARGRRLAIARLLDRIERALPAVGDRPAERPPWALWHDPGAQAAYVAAEALADRWWSALGPTPAAGELARVIADAHQVVDLAARRIAP